MAWGFQSNRIIELKKIALRIITLSNYTSHTKPLYKKLSMLKADDNLKLQQLTFYYKYLHNNLPVYLQNWRIIFNFHRHNYDIRIKNGIYTYKAKHKFAKCLQHNLPCLLNNIPTIVKEKLNTHSLQDLLSTLNLIFFTKLSRFMHKTKLLCMQHLKRQPPVILILKLCDLRITIFSVAVNRAKTSDLAGLLRRCTQPSSNM